MSYQREQARVPTEHEEQREIVRWFRHTWPNVKIFAVPNGESRSMAAGSRLKAEGVTPGVPDLFVPAWHLWIEMKRSRGGRVSLPQKKMLNYLAGCGYECIVAFGADDAKQQIKRMKGV